MTDNDGFADTPGREATPEEEARVAALLAGLSDDDLPMPDHVWSRLSAVIAEEHVAATARRLSGDPAALADEASADGSTAAPTATVSVLPTAEERGRRGAPRWLLPAAAAVVVLLGGALVKGIDVGSSTTAGGASFSSAEAAAAPSTAPSADRLPVPTTSSETRSGKAYTKDGLAAQARALVGYTFNLARPNVATGSFTADAAGTPSDSTPKSASGSAVAPLPTSSGALSNSGTGTSTGTTAAGSLLAGTSLAACLIQLTGTTTSGAVAVDRGTFEGKPADVVVVPTDGDPTHLDVWVLAPGCTRTEAQVLSFARIARP